VAITPREPATLDWGRFPWAEAISWFAKGLGATHLGQTSEVKSAAERLEQLESRTSAAGEQLFARNIRVLRLEVLAWRASSEGKKDSSIFLMRAAAELEESTPKHAVTPGPILPARELWGDLHMEQQQPAAALGEYGRSLALYPKRFNSLLGAARAARALGDVASAASYYRELTQVADGGVRQPAMREAQDFLRARP
jgi:tetratricopeptide (TPR) repeat protein